MPAALHCPHCGHQMPHYDWRRDLELRKAGLCVDCKSPLSTGDIAASRWRCVSCRNRRKVAMREKRARA